mgnify:CR=1 FL=1
MKKRTRARELALQALYQLDLQGESFATEVGDFVRDEEPDAETADFAIELVRGVVIVLLLRGRAR